MGSGIMLRKATVNGKVMESSPAMQTSLCCLSASHVSLSDARASFRRFSS